MRDRFRCASARTLWSYALFSLLCLPAASFAASYTLYIKAGTLTVNGAGGSTLKVWGYTDNPAAGPMVPGPILEAEEDEPVTVTVYNQHNIPHNFIVRGASSDNTTIAPGSSHTYQFTPPKAGAYLVYDSLNNNINREMGLYTALIVRAKGDINRAWTNGPSFDYEDQPDRNGILHPLARNWVLGEMDKPRWNDVAGNGGSVNTGTFRPNYFLINGLGGFDGMHDPRSVIQAKTGKTGLVRIVNAGQFDYSLHFHGNHFQIIDRDGTRLSPAEWGDTINVKAGTTAMVTYKLIPGIYPMHIHTAQMETANGVYLNGVATLLVGNK
jgi:FtsP/CotA-like multicopper oxidase with cupredoxin domain